MQNLQRDENLLHRLQTEGIAHFRPVDGELTDAVFGFLKLDVFEGFDRGPHGAGKGKLTVVSKPGRKSGLTVLKLSGRYYRINKIGRINRSENPVHLVNPVAQAVI